MINNVIYFLFMDCGNMVETSIQNTDGIDTKKKKKKKKKKARGNRCLKLFNIC